MARDHEATLRRLPGAFGHVECDTSSTFDQSMFLLEAFVCAAHPWPDQGAQMARAADSLQVPSFGPPWVFDALAFRLPRLFVSCMCRLFPRYFAMVGAVRPEDTHPHFAGVAADDNNS